MPTTLPRPASRLDSAPSVLSLTVKLPCASEMMFASSGESFGSIPRGELGGPSTHLQETQQSLQFTLAASHALPCSALLSPQTSCSSVTLGSGTLEPHGASTLSTTIYCMVGYT